MAMMVCPEPPAAQIGGQILAAGGNAADAAVAAAFAQGVSSPFMCGLGGTAILLHLDQGGKPTVLNGEAAIGSGRVPPVWVETLGARSEAIGRYHIPSEDNQIGATSAMVPGFVAACHALYERFGSGRLNWRELIEPSIRLAERGFQVYPNLALVWDKRADITAPAYPAMREKFDRDDNTRLIFMKAGDQPYQEGDLFRQPILAATLDQLASAGAQDFYTGAIGKTMASDLEHRNSLIRHSDLAAYTVIEQSALSSQFRGYSLLTTPPPSPGVQFLEMLGIVDALGADLGDPDRADTIHRIAQVMRAGFSDNRDIKAVPLAQAMEWAHSIMNPRRHADWARRIDAAQTVTGPASASSTGTTHLVVIDNNGSAISFTHSVGSTGGSGAVTPGLGFLHNNFLGHFDPRAGKPMSIVPGRRIGSGMPTIALRDNKIKLVIGAPGGSRIITSIFQTVLEVLGRGTRVDAAVRKLRFHSEEENLIHLEPGWPEPVAAALRASGSGVQSNSYQARVQAIEVAADGCMIAGVDPRGGAVSEAMPAHSK